MIGKDTKLCPAPAKGGLSAIAIAAIIVAAVALLIIALGVIFIIYYKNKHLDWRKKIMQFSNSDSNRTPSTTFEDLPASTASSLAGTINTARRISGLPAMFTEKRNSATPSTLTSRRKSGVLFPSWLQNPSAIRTVSQQVGLEMVMETDLWEMPRDQVIVKRDIKLGNGVYGEVFKGVIIGKAPIEEVYKTAFFAHQYDDCECAVKMLHSYAEANSRAEFLQEIGFMKELGFHPNIANMLGCITVSTPMCLLLEYAHYGDMARFLRERKDRVTTAPRLSSPAERAASNDDSVSIKDLLSFCWQISDGMEYLTELGFVHRDLAARNVLVDKAMNAMIGDFGLCRKADNVAFTSKAGRLPIKWMAIESLKSYQFSTKSDVWSFGVLMFEIFSMGMVPYIDVPQTEMLSYLCAGKRLPRPKNASLDIYDIMQSCWKERAADRPSFNSLRERLARHLEDATEDYGYLNLSQVPTGSRTSTVSDAEL
uniref:Protein kinase domain-containing protein n=1 Tax=Plectus sambesii TaxID=2011161 RepID=A0A914WNH4_9BILA